MANDRNSLKAGIFIVVAIVLGVVILVAIKGTGSMFNPMRDLTVAFDLTENVGGLKVGDTVRVGGVDQGRVKNIRFVEKDADRNYPHFEVDFTLPTKYDVRRDATVQVEQGLTGTSNLNISAFGAAAGIKSGEILDGMGSALAEFYAIAPEAKELVSRVTGKIDPGYAKYETVMSKAEATLAKADSALATGDAALANARDILGDTKTDIRGTMANLNAATGTLKERLPAAFAKAEEFLDKTTKTVEGAKGTLEDLRQTAANTKDATAEARSLLVRNRSKIDNMIASLRGTSTNLESASAEIRRSPWRLLYQPKADELSNLNIYDSAREFASAATHLNDAASAVRDATQDPTITPDQMKALLTSLDASFAKYKDVETKLWDAVK